MTKQNSIFTNRKLFLGLHILAWLIILLIPRYIINTYGGGQNRFLIPLYTNITLHGSLFYLNYLILVPHLYLSNYKKGYLIVSVIILFVFCILLWYVNERILFNSSRFNEMKELFDAIVPEGKRIQPPPHQLRLLNHFYTSVLIYGFSLGLRLIQKVNKDERERKELEKERLNSELAFLKNQVSPHFFFNTLNNIYSLIDLNTETAKESVHKLSKLMRYLLYESEREKLPLSDELAFLNHYIDLMKLRLNPKVKLEIHFPEKYPNHLIPPLLFIPFVENAFKHGISYRESSYIHINMKVTENNIQFSTLNGNVISNSNENNDHSGLGLKNVKKRLNLLFPVSHILDIKSSNEQFAVNLIIYIS